MGGKAVQIMMVLPVAFLAGCSTIEETNQMQHQALKRIDAIQVDVAELVKTQQTDEQKSARVDALRVMVSDRVADYTDFELFLGLSLPEDPDEDEVNVYISKVLATSESQPSSGSGDLQVKLLTDLGRKHLPELLSQLSICGESDYRSGRHLKEAISQLITPDDKEQFLSVLETAPDRIRRDLLSIVSKMGWEKDAKDILVDALQKKMGSSGYVDSTVLSMLIKLEDPELYPVLMDAVAKSANFSFNYRRLKDLEGIDCQQMLDTAWTYRLSQSNSDQLFLAQYAALKGDSVALDMLISALTPNPALRLSFDPRFAVLAAIDFRGTDEEVQTWYAKNKSDLVFNAEAKRFSVEKNEPSQPVVEAAAE